MSWAIDLLYKLLWVAIYFYGCVFVALIGLYIIEYIVKVFREFNLRRHRR